MDDPVDDAFAWVRVGTQAKQRLMVMRVWGNLTAIARDSGVSDATWKRLLYGKPVTRQDKRIQICDYLGWPLDGIERLLAGETLTAPPPLSPNPQGEASQLGDLLARQDGLEMAVRQLTATVEQILAELEELRGDGDSDPQRASRPTRP